MTRQSPSAPGRPAPARRLLLPLERFLHVEAASGIILLVTTAVALIWANSPWHETYEEFWHSPLTFGIGTLLSTQSLHFWINDGLMTIFFLVVGLEIRRELHEGALASLRQAALPAIAALGGVVAPAAIYFAVNHADPELHRGWAVPTATDIAFAVGVLALVGKRVPNALRVLLLALAIIDDIAAIVVIALFYSSGVSSVGLAIAAGGILGVFTFQWLGVRSAWMYVIPGSVIWLGMLQAGVHPAIAGVIAGLLTPVKNLHVSEEHNVGRSMNALQEFRARRHGGERDPQALNEPLRELKDAQIDLLPPAMRVQVALHPWVAFGIMPLFALANAGVSFTGLSFDDPSFMNILAGVAGGLVIGKPLGIVLATVVAVKLGVCALPQGVGKAAITVLGLLGGIGFTMAIFIANLAFPGGETLASAKFAILVASTVAAVAGLAVARLMLAAPSGPQGGKTPGGAATST